LEQVVVMARTTRRWVLVAVILAVGAAFGASLLPRLSAAPASTRTIYMAAVEPKGGTTVDKETFPTAALPAGGGYVLKAPDSTGRWEVSTYQWQPSFIVVNEGEQVTLEIIGINGKEHVSTIPGFVPSFTVRRGQITRASFTANRAGIFPIVCVSHQPTMTGYLVVLPR
jgi:plastocyanin